MQDNHKELVTGARSVVTKVADAGPAAKDMGLDMNSWGGLVSDYLLGGTVGKNRAGRAKHLARAMHDDEIPLSVNHPATSNLLWGVGGGLAGAGLGAGIGSVATDNPNGGAAGGALGAVGGMLAGLLTNVYKRRNAMKSIADDYEAGIPADPSVKPNVSRLNALLPLGGPVLSGEADVYEALNNKYDGDSNKVTPSTGRTLLNTGIEVGSRVHPMASGPVMLGAGMGQTINARRRVNAVSRGSEDGAPPKENARRQARLAASSGLDKTAVDQGMFQQLLAGGKSLINKVDLKNPAHTGALGAGAGAIGGLASGALSGEEEPGYLQRALMGGAAGGVAGAGLGMAGGAFSKFKQRAQAYSDAKDAARIAEFKKQTAGKYGPEDLSSDEPMLLPSTPPRTRQPKTSPPALYRQSDTPAAANVHNTKEPRTRTESTLRRQEMQPNFLPRILQPEDLRQVPNAPRQQRTRTDSAARMKEIRPTSSPADLIVQDYDNMLHRDLDLHDNNSNMANYLMPRAYAREMRDLREGRGVEYSGLDELTRRLKPRQAANGDTFATRPSHTNQYRYNQDVTEFNNRMTDKLNNTMSDRRTQLYPATYPPK